MSAMTKNIFQGSGNTILGVGSIYTLIRDELNILLSIFIAVLTIVYIIHQTRKCIEDTKMKRLERKVFEEDHKKELHTPAAHRHKHTKTPVEDHHRELHIPANRRHKPTPKPTEEDEQD